MLKIVKYKLDPDGKGSNVQPYQTIEAMDCTFEGGLYMTGLDKFMLGYVTGASGGIINAAIAACSRHQMSVMTEIQAMQFADAAFTPGAQDPLTGLYRQLATAVDGRIVQGWLNVVAVYAVTPPSDIPMLLTPMSSVDRLASTPALGAIILDTTDHKLYYGDGNTAGGVAI